jgi:uncharacterized membrane protein
MLRPLVRWLTPLLLLGTLAVSTARADDETIGEGPSYVFPGFLIILFSIVVLFILCKPSRKG